MKHKILIIIGLIIGILVFIVAKGVSVYNNLVDQNEEVESSLSTVYVQLERRADLIPNLVNTVKGYMKHEESIIESITEARTELMGAKTLEEKQEANGNLDAALSNLFLIVENYPDLKANTNFINLQDELAGTENRIAVARKDYNSAVSEYNSQIKKFPNVIFAGMFKFEEKEYFEVSEGKNEVPEVDFNK